MAAGSSILHESRLDQLRGTLAHELGFSRHPNEQLATPYLNYIENRPVGDSSLENYLAVFLRVVKQLNNVSGRTNPGNSTSSSTLGGTVPDSLQTLVDTLT